jgi:cell filamentation protein
MTRYSDHDEYVDPTTGVLKNLLGISDAVLLERAEADFVSTRSAELSFLPVDGRFDLQNLQTIHWYLFRDVYAWAGSLRTVDISKGDNRFAHHAFIESASKPIFQRLRDEHYLAGLDKDAFCLSAAYYLGELNALHPFREGNGRTQREFINLLARRNGFIFVWEKADRQELLMASIQSFKGDLVELAEILRAIIQ